MASLGRDIGLMLELLRCKGRVETAGLSTSNVLLCSSGLALRLSEPAPQPQG